MFWRRIADKNEIRDRLMNNPASYMKIKGPCRDQVEFQKSCLDTLLPPEHLARSVWAFVEAMDTRPCFSYVNTFQGCDGRPTTSPKVLLALWLYSILDGNRSARRLATLCQEHNAYKWIAGGTETNRTMLAQFCSKDPMKFEDLLTNCLAVMFKARLIDDKDFSQDGTKVKANAGFNSYRTKPSLQTIKETIKAYIKQLSTDTEEYEKRDRKRRLAIAKNRLERVEEALATLEKEQEIKKDNGTRNHNRPSEEDLKNVRASTTDPVVRKMKMGDGGFRLSYNIQFATGVDSRVIYGVDVVTTLDPGTSPRMMAKVHSRLAKLKMSAPKNWVADSAYSSREDIDTVAKLFPDCRYYAPPKVTNKTDPKKPRKGDSEAVLRWREMIDSDDVKDLYKKRCSTAEFSNAQVKNRGLKEFLLRGLEKVKGTSLLHAIAQNLSRFLHLKTLKKSSNGLVATA